MTKIRIATFNCENLFARYRFNSNFTPSEDGFTINDIAFTIQNEAEKRITAKAIKDIDADIICLQEIENMPVLERFNSERLGGHPAKRYRHKMLVDGNDSRSIDVAVLSRFPIVSMRSHRHERNKANTGEMFSRDCLRVDFDIDGFRLAIYVNHLKSMMEGRKVTRPKREEQAVRVLEILKKDWGPDLDGHFVVAGDMNDYPGSGTALTALLAEKNLINVVKRLPKADRWTHYFKTEATYHQLDYLLVSKKLDDLAENPIPGRNLRGLPWRADKVLVDRYDEVGEDNPKASDHVPVYLDLDLP